MNIKLSEFVYFVENLCKKEKEETNIDHKISISAVGNNYSARIVDNEGQGVKIEVTFIDPTTEKEVTKELYHSIKPEPEIIEDGLGYIQLCSDVKPIDTASAVNINETDEYIKMKIANELDKIEPLSVITNSIPLQNGQIAVYGPSHIKWIHLNDNAPFYSIGFIADKNIKSEDIRMLKYNSDAMCSIIDGLICIYNGSDRDCYSFVHIDGANKRSMDEYIDLSIDMAHDDTVAWLTKYNTDYAIELCHDKTFNIGVALNRYACCIAVEHHNINSKTHCIEVFDKDFNEMPAFIFNVSERTAHIIVLPKIPNNKSVTMHNDTDPRYIIIHNKEDEKDGKDKIEIG